MTRILLIEPDQQLAAIYRALCERLGYEVVWAAHAEDAIVAADGAMPDLVLLELQLAGHNGVEFLYEFRSYAEWQHIPIILLTHVQSSALRMTQESLASLGIVEYLYKSSTTLVQLQRAINEQLAPAIA